MSTGTTTMTRPLRMALALAALLAVGPALAGCSDA